MEDWYQGIELPRERWGDMEPRLERGVERLLSLLAEADVRSTWFILGCNAEEHPDLVRAVADAGHELGTHLHTHTHVWDMDRDTFRDELRRSVGAIEDAAGAPVRGHRAPFFSINETCLWALDVLAEEGMTYDASLFPGHNWRYGLPGASRRPGPVADGALWEFPMTLMDLGPVSAGMGGAYLRVLPPGVIRGTLWEREAARDPAIFYCHPWELDPGHPKIDHPDFHWLARTTHYWRLGSMEPRLRRLLRDHRFTALEDLLPPDRRAA